MGLGGLELLPAMPGFGVVKTHTVGDLGKKLLVDFPLLDFVHQVFGPGEERREAFGVAEHLAGKRDHILKPLFELCREIVGVDLAQRVLDRKLRKSFDEV